ncbi:sporulation protein YtxC [Aneurinibacillus sp. REN35]|uniref:sporulation protein YtxC n=1 Tax=Aneurinibacillus sp. REN35 TaxID=3237286 RepID=UPI0035285696
MRWVQLSLPYTDEHLLPEFRSALYHELEKAENELQFEIREERDGAGWHFHCVGWPRWEQTILVQETWLFALARAIHTYISAKEEERIYGHIIGHNYYDRVMDKARLIHYVKEHIREQEVGEMEYGGGRIHRVQKEVMHFLEHEHVLQLKGFFQFRLRGYMNELCAMVDAGMELYMAEEEQELLIRRLRTFLLAFPRRSGVLRVVHTSIFSFRYYDEGWERLSPPKTMHFPMEAESTYIAEEVKIIGALAGFAPERVIMYTRQPNHEFIQMLTRIFADRMDVYTDFSFPAHVGVDT